MYADSHMHSNYSDGTNEPNELVNMALKNNVGVISLVDHDTIDGLDEFINCCDKSGIIGIPGVEISTSISGTRIHILGYFIDRYNQDLLRFFDDISIARTRNTRDILEKLNLSNRLDYTWNDVMKHNIGKKWICSSHVYEAMKKDGLFTGWDEWPSFYHSNFGIKSSAYIDIDGYTPMKAIEVIKGAGGKAVVAHPKLIGDDREVEKLIELGIDGIEVCYPAHSDSDVIKYQSMAKKYNLIQTGGTDWHGALTQYDVTIGRYGLSEREYIDNMNKR